MLLLLLLFAKKRNTETKKFENEVFFQRFQILRSDDFPFKKQIARSLYLVSSV
jgi:hypothetical protein